MDEPKKTRVRNVLADLHNHLKTGSNMDGLLVPALAQARRTLGENGILGVVDFDNFGPESRYLQLLNQAVSPIDYGFAFYNPHEKILVLKGQEVRTKQGHLLVMGLDRQQSIESDRSLEDTIRESMDKGGILIADHPFYHPRISVGNFIISNKHLIPHLDAIEVYNGEASFGLPFLLPFDANERAIKFYLENFGRNELGAVSSSDGHSIKEIGTNFTSLEIPEESFASSEILKEQLRYAIKNAGLRDCNMVPGKIGALKHSVSCVAYNFLPSIAKRLNL